MSAQALHPDLRHRVLGAVVSTLKRFGVSRGGPEALCYPMGIPELEKHLDLLADLALRYRGPPDVGGMTLAELRERICAECPFQFPVAYCPVREHGDCTPLRLAEPLMEAIRTSIIHDVGEHEGSDDMPHQTSLDRAGEEQADRQAVEPRRVFDRLLVAVDRSPQAEQAVMVAVHLAEQMHADVVLLHVYSEAQLLLSQELAFLAPEIRAACVESSNQLLADLKAKVPAGTRVETVVRTGDAATEILRAADLYDASMIVIGMHASDRLETAVAIGHVARAVMRRATCPVLNVVRPHAADALRSFAAEVAES